MLTLGKLVSTMYDNLLEVVPLDNFSVGERPVEGYPHCAGKTNSGNEVVILVSPWKDMIFDKTPLCSRRDAQNLKEYLERTHSFLGYPVGKVHLVYHAEARDLETAVKNPMVSSLVLFGHFAVGSWRMADRHVTHYDVARWAEEGGHCKTGFGLKTGCNVIHDKHIRDKYNLPDDVDQHQLLAPIFSHNAHSGDLFIVKGMPYTKRHYLNGSEATYGLSNQLLRLVPSYI